MLTRSNRVLATASVLTFALSACGGGGGGVASMPPPAPTPTPSPTPTPTPTPTPGATVLPPTHLGLVSSGSFAALGVTDGYTTNSLDGDRQPRSDPTNADVKFSYDPGSNTYQITLPGFQTGTLANTAYNGSVGEIATSTTSQVTAGSSTTLQPLFVAMPVPGSNHSQYTYTSFGEWDGKTGETNNGRTIWAEGIFAYGIPTAAGDVPTTGSASYTADIRAGWTRWAISRL